MADTDADMSAMSRLLADTNAVIFVLLAVASVREYRRGQGPASAWAATAFGTLGLLAALAFLPVPSDGIYDDLWWQILVRVILAILVLFPYFLYRLAATFHRPSTALRRMLDGLTAAVIVSGFLLPRFPGPSEPRPKWLALYSVAILTQWTIASIFAARGLWNAGEGRPSAPRNRMRLLAAGVAAVNISLLLSAIHPSSDPHNPNPLMQLLNLACGLIFFAGLAPPHALVERWRRPQQDAARRAMSELMSAVTAEEVAVRILPHICDMVGADGAAFVAEDGEIVSSHGSVDGLEDGDESTGVLRFPLKSGGALVVCSATYSPLFGSDRIPMLRSFADLSDLALARCAAGAREREFISNAAHELRTPMTTMTGLAAIIAMDRERMTDKQIEDCISGIVRQGNRARELVNTLLDMAQIERGSVAFEDDVVELCEIVANALDFTPAPTNRRVNVEIPEELKVRGDAQRLQQVIVNLITNAYRYGGQEISIGVETNDGKVILSVADNGEGVPNDLVPKLFDPFSRAATAHGIGSGLGLAICRTIVDALGGSIHYDPAPDGGARFKVGLRKAA